MHQAAPERGVLQQRDQGGDRQTKQHKNQPAPAGKSPARCAPQAHGDPGAQRGHAEAQDLLPRGWCLGTHQPAFIRLARGSAADLATRCFEHGIGWYQQNLVGGQADDIDGGLVDFLAQSSARRRVDSAGFGQHDQALAGVVRVRAGEHRNTALAHAGDVADRLLQFVGIEVAPTADDQILDPAGEVDLALDAVGIIAGVEPALVK